MNLMEVVNQAAALPNDAERVAFFETVFAKQPELRPQLEQLLGYLIQVKLTNHENVAQQPPTLPEGSATSDYAPKVGIGSVIAGKYKIREKLGEGGMGTVYIVDTIRDVRTSFALKLIKSEYASHQVIARFEQERQALALMNHPNIAKFIDAGTSESGQPYFVMEHIKGLSITTFCDQEKLTVEERLTLFQSVCHAVQHAHMKGIIHRDLKPGNILVTYIDGKPVPKVIDFGVAKATLQPLTDKTIHSEINSIIGTLEYMAPEQAEVNSLDIDTRADIYALGVILYELLTGALPFSRKELVGVALLRMLEIIRLEEPAKPSTKLSNSGSLPSIAATRKIDPALLMKKLRGEIDWIIMKCLEKERGRRYIGPNELAKDIDNYLHDLPLIASPPSKSYRLKKFLRRHQGKVIAAWVLVLSLVGGVAGTTWGMMKAVKAEHEAELEAAIAKSTQEFLENDLILQVDADEQAKSGNPIDKDVRLRTLLDRAANNINKGKFAGQPLVLASLELTIGKAYLALGLYDEARPHLDRSYELRLQHLGKNDPETLASRLGICRHLLYKTKYKEADEALRILVQDAEPNPKVPLEFVQNSKIYWGSAKSNLSDYAGAERLFQEVYDARRKEHSESHPLTLKVAQRLAGVLRFKGDYQNAEGRFLITIKLMRQTLGNDHPDTLRCIQNLESMYVAKQEFSKAEPLVKELVQTGGKVYTDDHPLMLVYYNDLATIAIRQGRTAEAIQTFDKLTTISAKRNTELHGSTIGYALNWASCLILNKQFPEAELIFLKYRPIVEKVYGNDHRTMRRLLRSLVKLYEDTNRMEKADECMTELLRNARESKSVPKDDLFIEYINAAKLKSRLKRVEDLQRLLMESERLQDGINLPQYQRVAWRRLHAELALLENDPATSKRWLLEGVTMILLDRTNNPNRYKEDPYAAEEMKDIKLTLESYISKHGYDKEIVKAKDDLK
jgi:serine/threonine protein kinase